MAYDVLRGRKIFGGRLGVPPRRRVPPAVQRRRDRERAHKEAKAKYPNLEAKLDKIVKRIREARISGRRFAYKKPLRDLYKMAYRWNEAGKLAARIAHVATIRAIPIRANANPFSVLVRAVLDEDAERRTISRWSGLLNRALSAGVAPSDLNEHI